jgi:hypothetical protein
MSLRCEEPGWRRRGRIDKQGRRSLWIRESPDAIELCAGREGNDAYVRLPIGTDTVDHCAVLDLCAVLQCARFAAEYEDDDGLTLEREGIARGEVVK